MDCPIAVTLTRAPCWQSLRARGMSNMDTHFAQDYRELMSAAGEAAHPPVIFLDIDGVLNRTSGATHIRLDQDLVSRLRIIVQRSGCRIVLSTF